jgi:hypothetical protein
MWFWTLLLSLSSAHLPGFEGEMPSFQEALQYVSSIVDDVSIDLTDANFESVTQAGNKATTSDWFVYFYSPACMKCQFMTPQWKLLAERVKEEGLKTNMGKVNADHNEMILRRFMLYSFPAFLYFKEGYYYNYTAQATPDELYKVVSEDGYKAFERREVPHEITWLWDWYMFLRWWALRLKGYFIGGGAALLIYKVTGWVKGKIAARGREKSE